MNLSRDKMSKNAKMNQGFFFHIFSYVINMQVTLDHNLKNRNIKLPYKMRLLHYDRLI